MTISVSYKFDEAVVLITGAGSGIGAALARHCARQGASVIAVDRTHDNLLRGLEPSLRNKIDVRQADVSSEAAVTRVIDEVRRKYPRLDAAVLAAAIQVRTNLDDMTGFSLAALPDGNGKANIVGVLNGLKGHLKSGSIAACQQDVNDARSWFGGLSDVQKVEVGSVGLALDVIQAALDGASK